MYTNEKGEQLTLAQVLESFPDTTFPAGTTEFPGFTFVVEQPVAATPSPILSVPMVKARKALLLEGVTDAYVRQVLAQLPSPNSDLALIDWEYEQFVHLDNPLVAFVASKKGWGDAKVRDLFAKAATL